MATAPDGEMPFLDHLEELRWRLLWSVGALFVGTVIALGLIVRFEVIALLLRPITPFLAGGRVVYTNPGEPLRIVLMLSFVLGLVIALPVIVYQLWGFLSPALYTHEKKVIVPVLAGAALLFLIGVALAFFVVLPVTLGFLLQFQTSALQPMITASEYFGFAVGMAVAFGAAFELPIAVLALTALGLVTPRLLARFRRHALVVCIVGAAFITPGGDPFSLAALAVPLYLLYELGIGLSGLVYRRRQRRAAAEANRIGAVA